MHDAPGLVDGINDPAHINTDICTASYGGTW